MNNTNNARLVLLHGLAASIFFCVGSIAITTSFRFAGFASVIYQIILFIGYFMLMVHAGLELFIDFRLSGDRRLFAHTRFGGSKILNICNSIAFGLAAVLELIARSLQVVNSNLELYLWLYSIAAHLFLLSAILTFINRGCCGCLCNIELEGQQAIHHVGNSLFFIGAAALVLGSYDQQANPNEFLAFFLQWTAYGIWVLVGIAYTLSDALDLNKYKSNGGDRSGELNTSSEPIV